MIHAPKESQRKLNAHTKGKGNYSWTGINTPLDKLAKPGEDNSQNGIHSNKTNIWENLSFTSNQKNTNKKYNEISFYDY